MIYIGIDPGLSGAVAAINDAGSNTWVWDAPVVTLKKARRDYATASMARIFQQFPESRDACRAVVERTHAMPKNGSISAWKLGRGAGLWEGILAAHDIPYTLVLPQRWKAAMLDGTDKGKGASLVRAQQLFPTAELTLKKHEGRAEALLMAAYCRLLHLGEAQGGSAS